MFAALWKALVAPQRSQRALKDKGKICGNVSETETCKREISFDINPSPSRTEVLTDFYTKKEIIAGTRPGIGDGDPTTGAGCTIRVSDVCVCAW